METNGFHWNRVENGLHDCQFSVRLIRIMVLDRICVTFVF